MPGDTTPFGNGSVRSVAVTGLAQGLQRPEELLYGKTAAVRGQERGSFRGAVPPGFFADRREGLSLSNSQADS